MIGRTYELQVGAANQFEWWLQENQLELSRLIGTLDFKISVRQNHQLKEIRLHDLARHPRSCALSMQSHNLCCVSIRRLDLLCEVICTRHAVTGRQQYTWEHRGYIREGWEAGAPANGAVVPTYEGAVY